MTNTALGLHSLFGPCTPSLRFTMFSSAFDTVSCNTTWFATLHTIAFSIFTLDRGEPFKGRQKLADI